MCVWKCWFSRLKNEYVPSYDRTAFIFEYCFTWFFYPAKLKFIIKLDVSKYFERRGSYQMLIGRFYSNFKISGVQAASSLAKRSPLQAHFRHVDRLQEHRLEDRSGAQSVNPQNDKPDNNDLCRRRLSKTTAPYCCNISSEFIFLMGRATVSCEILAIWKS